MGGSGDDILFGLGAFDTLVGGDGNDFILGGDDNDVISGGEGNDTLEGGLGADFIIGDAGTDILRQCDLPDFNDASSDTLVAIDGDADSVFSESGDATILDFNLDIIQ
jgi:Ca2+-binding RTX toxin-like protein